MSLQFVLLPSGFLRLQNWDACSDVKHEKHLKLHRKNKLQTPDHRFLAFPQSQFNLARHNVLPGISKWTHRHQLAHCGQISRRRPFIRYVRLRKPRRTNDSEGQGAKPTPPWWQEAELLLDTRANPGGNGRTGRWHSRERMTARHWTLRGSCRRSPASCNVQCSAASCPETETRSFISIFRNIWTHSALCVMNNKLAPRLLTHIRFDAFSAQCVVLCRSQIHVQNKCEKKMYWNLQFWNAVSR